MKVIWSTSKSFWWYERLFYTCRQGKYCFWLASRTTNITPGLVEDSLIRFQFSMWISHVLSSLRLNRKPFHNNSNYSRTGYSSSRFTSCTMDRQKDNLQMWSLSVCQVWMCQVTVNYYITFYKLNVRYSMSRFGTVWHVMLWFLVCFV